MKAIDFELGDRFENINTGDTFVVVNIDGTRYFENEIKGDLYTWVDEDLYIELVYENDEDLYQ